MNLLLDVGNTRLKWALVENNQIQEHGGFVLASVEIEEELERLFSPIVKPNQIMVASVNTDIVNQAISDYFSAKLALTPIWINSTVELAKFGVCSNYDKIETLGIDRWLSMIAARQKTAKEFVVIDCGSAITIDFVDQDGLHHGGLIMPGISMMRNSLTGQIPQLVDDESVLGELALAQQTQNAIVNGCYYATVATIELLYDKLLQEHGSNMDFFITGGDARLMYKQMTKKLRYEPHLVLQGLIEIDKQL